MMTPDWLLSLLPILLILFLMLRLRWGAARAGPVGWLAAALIAWLHFGAGPRVFAVAQAKAGLLALDVLMIVWAAFLLYRVTDEAGAIETLSDALGRLTSDRGTLALIVGWTFATFLQGVGGFGVPTAVTAPLLIGLGFTPLAAVVIPSLGHAWSVTFGSLASSFQALMGATGLPGEQLAGPSAAMLTLAGFACGLMVLHAAEGWAGVRRGWSNVLILGAAMGAAQIWLATHQLWNLASFGSGLVGLATGLIITSRREHHARQKADARFAPGSLALALSGYLALIIVAVVVLLVRPVHDMLSTVVLRVDFPAVLTARGHATPAGPGRVIPIFRHAGSILAYASALSYLIFMRAGKYSPGATRRILVGTYQRVVGSSLGIAAMVSMAVLMSHAGMTDSIARGLAASAGSLFPSIASWIGALGAFMTGSNTNSNVVFAMLQMRTAQLLHLSVPLILAAQTAGGAIGSVIAPTKVIVGASTAGMAGREGAVMRKMAPYVALLLALISLATLIAGAYINGGRG